MRNSETKQQKKGKEGEDELCPDNEPIPFEITDKLRKSVCKIKCTQDYNIHGTGFFMEYKSNNYLITNYHVISENIKDIEIEIWNNKKYNLNLNNRYVKFIKMPKDITSIKINENELNDIIYLKYDSNYKENGYSHYINNDILNIGYPNIDGLSSGTGKLKEINDYEFYHNIPIKQGSSGSPIILYNLLTVIGIHKQADKTQNLNVGTFIGELIKDMDSSKNEIICVYNKKDENSITLLYGFDNDELEKEEIINNPEKKELYEEAKNNINEKNIEIYINNKKMEFDNIYDSNENGLINVKFKFNKLLTSIGWMFLGCSSLETIDLSSFKTNNVSDMEYMFSDCSSLKSIDLSSFNTNNVINMDNMFFLCSSLKSIKLPSFSVMNTINMDSIFAYCSSLKSIDFSSLKNIKLSYMNSMFYGCSALESINLSSINTVNVTSMEFLLCGCSSLKSLDLSSFNTNNVINMEAMFGQCSSIVSLDLSSFNTNNVTNMSSMFSYCKSLKSIDLSSFNTNNVTDISHMFYDCSSLTNINFLFTILFFY